MSIQVIRNQIKVQRQQLSKETISVKSLAISKRLIASTIFQRATHIACYLPVKGEVDIQTIIATIFERKKCCYLPILHPLKHNLLWFVRYQTGDQLVPNYLGIPEPSLKQHDVTPPWAIDLVIMPLLAFDHDCNRLGMGGGFYDRTFSFKKEAHQSSKPLLMGVAYDFQCVSKLEPQPWDIPLDYVMTESMVYPNDNSNTADSSV